MTLSGKADTAGLRERNHPPSRCAGGCGNGAMAEPLRHRQTKEAATDMFYLTLPRHISTLPKCEILIAKRGRDGHC